MSNRWRDVARTPQLYSEDKFRVEGERSEERRMRWEEV